MAKNKSEEAGYLAIGRIVAPHGITGELKVELLTDYPERFQQGARIHLGTETRAEPAEIVSARPHKHGMLVRLANVLDRDAAEALRGQYLLIPEGEARPLGEHENYVHDLIGLEVQTVEGQALGHLTDILTTGSNDVYVVEGEGGEVLIPALREVIVSVDLAGQRMVVALPEGLL